MLHVSGIAISFDYENICKQYVNYLASIVPLLITNHFPETHSKQILEFHIELHPDEGFLPFTITTPFVPWVTGHVAKFPLPLLHRKCLGTCSTSGIVVVQFLQNDWLAGILETYTKRLETFTKRNLGSYLDQHRTKDVRLLRAESSWIIKIFMDGYFTAPPALLLLLQ